MSLIGNPLVSTNYQTNTFSGDGTTVAYTLSLAPASAASIAVYISGLYQTPSVAYTVSGTTLTFTGAPPTGTNNILVLHLGIKSSTLVPVDGSVTPSMLSNANVVFWSGANTNVGIGNTAPNAPLTIGAANGTFTNPLVQAASSANSWLQINAQNKSNGNNASTDLILARSDGNDSVGYIDMGINSNTYAQAAYSIMTPSSGYLFTNGGDLFLGTQTAHNVVIHTGNTTTGSTRLTVGSDGNATYTGSFGINQTPFRSLTVQGEFSLVPSSNAATAYFNVSDSLGSSGSAKYLQIRGLGTGGTAQATLSGITFDATAVYVGNDTNCNLADLRTRSIATNGYQKLPGGIIIQWGQASIPANSTSTFNFPIAFASSCASIQATHGAAGIWQSYTQYTAGPGGAQPISTSQFQISNLDDSTITYYWFAVGY